jgi:GT2 family glycosyltransferase
LLAVRNGEPYVRQAVASVLTQTFPDFEFVIVDDASTDGTVATIEALGDPRIRLLRNEANLGQVPSLNRGLREARGEYVARIDHDDWCLPTRLERQVAVLDREPAVGLVGTWMDLVDDRGRAVTELRSTIADYAEFLYHTLIMRVLISHPSAMYRREPVLALGGYDEATGPAEDKDLWRRLALERWDARIVPEPLVVYRLHEGQLSQTRAAYQRRVDEESQDRFLAALSPDGPVSEVRLLLTGGGHGDAGAALRRLDSILAGAAERLRLDPAEAARLQELVAARLVEVAAAAPWRQGARQVAATGLRRLPDAQRRPARARFALASTLAPFRAATRAVARGAARTPGLQGIRAPLRRVPQARQLYGKLTGSR